MYGFLTYIQKVIQNVRKYINTIDGSYWYECWYRTLTRKEYLTGLNAQRHHVVVEWCAFHMWLVTSETTQIDLNRIYTSQTIFSDLGDSDGLLAL